MVCSSGFVVKCQPVIQACVMADRTHRFPPRGRPLPKTASLHASSLHLVKSTGPYMYLCSIQTGKTSFKPCNPGKSYSMSAPGFSTPSLASIIHMLMLSTDALLCDFHRIAPPLPYQVALQIPQQLRPIPQKVTKTIPIHPCF